MTLDGPLANRDAWAMTNCSIEKSMAVVGSRSAMLIVREAYFGTTRFDDFARRVGITDAAASARLRDLVEAGILEKQSYREPGQRTRYEYVLTRKGRDLLPVVLALKQWGDEYLQPDGIPVDVVDADHGASIRVQVVDAAGEPLALDDLHVRGSAALLSMPRD